MSQHYSDPSREKDSWALPDVEVFYMNASAIKEAQWADTDGEPYEPGWYYWSCFPGCMPDSDPFGPFATEEEAVEDAQSQND